MTLLSQMSDMSWDAEFRYQVITKWTLRVCTHGRCRGLSSGNKCAFREQWCVANWSSRSISRTLGGDTPTPRAILRELYDSRSTAAFMVSLLTVSIQSMGFLRSLPYLLFIVSWRRHCTFRNTSASGRRQLEYFLRPRRPRGGVEV